MIHRVFSDLASFKTLEFHEGLNILVAEMTLEATDQDTRNSTGKSSLIELVRFLTGGNCGPHDLFRGDALNDAFFGMNFDLGHQSVTIERSGSTPGKVVLRADDAREWLHRPIRDSTSGLPTLRNDSEWRDVLGAEMFGLPASDDRETYGPTVRSLLSYLVRRAPGGFLAAHKQHPNQGPGDIQVNLAYLLGPRVGTSPAD